MDFIAFDFETANQQQAPCSLGLVLVKNNIIVDEFYTLINPQKSFSSYNVKIHGITKKDVEYSPTFPEVWPQIKHYFDRYPAVAHNAHFDKSVLEKAIKRYQLSILPIAYYDTMALYRHNCQATAGGLEAMCASLQIELEEHHNALADAKAAAQAMIALLNNESYAIYPCAIGELLRASAYIPDDENESEDDAEHEYPFVTTLSRRRSGKAWSSSDSEFVKTSAEIDIVEEIIFEGSNFVITGQIVGYGKPALETAIKNLGGMIKSAVSKKTNYVVVGLQDVSIVTDKTNAKGIKIIEAEKLRANGHDIKIVDANSLITALGGKKNANED